MPFDFEVSNHGSVALLFARTEEAEDWVQEHLPDDIMRHGDGYAIETNYLPPVLEGIAGDGLSIG